MESFCAGGVFSWAKRSSYGWGGGAAGDGGMIASSHTQGRPNLSRFLCRYAQKERPGFDFTIVNVSVIFPVGFWTWSYVRTVALNAVMRPYE